MAVRRAGVGQVLLEQCLVLTGQHAERTFHSSALLHLGMVLWDAGEPEAAEAMVLEGLELKVHDEEYVSQAVCLEALAWFSVADNPRRAATLAGCATTAWQRSGTSIVSVDALRRLRDESLEKLQHSLTESEFSRAWRLARSCRQPRRWRLPRARRTLLHQTKIWTRSFGL